jgi:SpoU rRNA methylase family enzyme
LALPPLVEPTPEQQGQLVVFFKDWRTALDQLAAAHTLVRHWKSEAKLKEARFKGAAELVFGSKHVTFTYNEVGGLTFVHKERRNES